MERVLPRPLTVPWRTIGLTAWFGLSVVLLLDPRIRSLSFLPNDWQVWTWVPGLIAEGRLYDGWIVWAPPMMWFLAFVVVPLGYAWWWAAHLLSLLTVERSVALLAFLSVPFWADAMNGQTVTFQFVAGWWALRGGWTWPFLLLAVLIPRPLVLPALAWVLWTRPESRWPFVGIAGLVLGISALSGDLVPWLGNMLAIGVSNYDHFANLSPTKVIGGAWLILGVPLAAWLTVKGRVGLAGLAMSPYILPMYPLVALWEWRRPS